MQTYVLRDVPNGDSAQTAVIIIMLNFFSRLAHCDLCFHELREH